MEKYIKFVDSFYDSSITPSHIRLYHRRLPANEAMEAWIDETIETLKNLNRDFIVVKSKDMKKVCDSLTGFRETTDQRVINMLNHKTREPRRLLFYSGALFEATVNTEGYSQSQIVMMLDVPTQKDVLDQKPIIVYAAPPGGELSEQMLAFGEAPNPKDLIDKGWKRVSIKKCGQRLITRNHMSACRRQYTLKHLGSSTVRRSIYYTFIIFISKLDSYNDSF